MITYQSLEGPFAQKVDQYFGIKGSLIEANPGRVLMPPQFEQIGQKIIDAPVREDDVWLISYPRTGSTWTTEMLWLIGHNFDYEAARTQIQHARTPLIELSSVLVNTYDNYMKTFGNSVDVVNSMPSPRYIKSHLPHSLLPAALDVVKPKIVYVARNPKDMCVSYYHYCGLAHNLKCTFEEFCDLILNDKAPIGPIWDHILGFWAKRNEPNVLFLRYEEMKRDLVGVIKKSAAFLGKDISEAEIQSLTDYLSFKSMKANPSVNFENLLHHVPTGKEFIRKGEVGDWKNYMTPEMAKRFDEWTEQNLRGTGLSFI